MKLRRGVSNLGQSRSSKNGRSYHFLVLSVFFVSIMAPVLLLSTKGGILLFTSGQRDFVYSTENVPVQNLGKHSNRVEGIDSMFSKKDLDIVLSDLDGSESLSVEEADRQNLSSSWVTVSLGSPTGVSVQMEKRDDAVFVNTIILDPSTGKSMLQHAHDSGSLVENVLVDNSEVSSVPNLNPEIPREKINSAQDARRKMRMERQIKRVIDLTQDAGVMPRRQENVITEPSKSINGGSVLSKYSVWRRDNEDNSDSLVRLMRDQLIMARVYASIALSHKQLRLLNELKQRMRDSQRTLGEANTDADLPRSAHERIKAMGQTLTYAREKLYDCSGVTKKLRAMLQLAEEQARVLKKQSTFLSQLAAKTLPKGIHCLAMRLTIEYYKLTEKEREFSGQAKLEDSNLFHYALFSDNVLAASVVVNSTVSTAKETSEHVFHIVTDKLNYAAMRMWFLANPPGNATIEVQNIDDFTWLNSSYCPVLRQLESAAMKEYYFKADHPTTLAAGSSNLKYRNPKYLSMLNHLRFYLPQIYPKLDKILFLDDDIVVQRDLTPLWYVDLHGKVNGAVETCGHSFHRFDKYLNFSNPFIKNNFDPNACGWAYGMNIFDLKQWKIKDITGIYHKWQDMNEDRILWKLGTLPPGLITFYNLTFPLEKSWHVLGLGYNPSVDRSEIEGAAVVHYNGNMKPWLELGMSRYKNYWTRHVMYDHPYLQQCNIT